MAWNHNARLAGFAARQRNGFARHQPCVVEGCTRPVASRRLCDPHYRRLLHFGTVDGSAPRRDAAVGRYRSWKRPGHPLANPGTGRVYVHRVVLHDSVRGSNLPCFWCGRPLRWTRDQAEDAITVDHRDRDRHNNDETNLVPACNTCNPGRNSRRLKPPLMPQYSAAPVAEFVWTADGQQVGS